MPPLKAGVMLKTDCRSTTVQPQADPAPGALNPPNRAGATESTWISDPGAGFGLKEAPVANLPLDPAAVDELLELLAGVRRGDATHDDALELAQILAGAFQRAGEIVTAARLNSWAEQRRRPELARDRPVQLTLVVTP